MTQRRQISEWEAARRAGRLETDADHAKARLPEARAAEARTVDAIAARIERGLERKAAEAVAMSEARAPERAAAEKIISARMIGAELQLKTVARPEIEVVIAEHVAIRGDAKGGDGVAKFEVRRLFNRAACAVLRLYHDGEISWSAVKAALAFAHAGDRVLGPVRVRTVEFERLRGALAPDTLSEIEKDTQARKRWMLAQLALCLEERRMLDGVMRFDESAVEAARAAFPRVRDRKKLSGMGDWALVRGARELAYAYGFETRERPVRPLAGL
jgi:hypothetical protein